MSGQVPARRFHIVVILSAILGLIPLTGLAATATALVPATAPHGARAIVVGTGLDATDVTVSFAKSGGGTISAIVVSRSTTLLELIVPSNAITGTEQVANTAGAIASFSYTLSADPTVTRVATLVGNPTTAPFSGPIGLAIAPNGDAYIGDR